MTTADEADRVMQSTSSVSRLNANTRADACSIKETYRAKSAQFEAERELSSARYAEALAALDAAERICPDLHLISSQDYLRAVALNGLARTEAARAAAARFLDYASAVHPAIYVQSDGPRLTDVRQSWANDHERLRVYRDRAAAYLGHRGALVWDEPREVPKFYGNNPFRPGGNRYAGGFIFPAFIEIQPESYVWAAAGYYSWGRTSVQGIYGYGTDSGNWFSGRVRRSVYESKNRDFDVDVFAGVRTTKRLRVTKTSDLYGPHKEIEVLDSSVDPGAGVGATYRLRPELGLSAQLAGVGSRVEHRVDVRHSLYAFYDLIDGISVNAGYIESRPMVALGILWVQVGYNFRDESVEAFLQNVTF